MTDRKLLELDAKAAGIEGRQNMIEFYDKQTGAVVDNKYDMYFVRGDGSVWCDNGKLWESQCSVIGFEECVWREVQRIAEEE